MQYRELDIFKILGIFGEFFVNALEFFDCLDLWEFIDLFVKILVFEKILGKGRRKED